MIELVAETLTPEAYAPYGEVVAGRSSPGRICNHGTAEAWDALATLVSTRGEEARAAASLYRCAPHLETRLEVRWLERHPCSTQMFVPMGGSRFLLVVGLGGDAPDLSTLAAFVVEGPRAITYRPGVWHHPMVALDTAIDFVNVLFSDGTEADCDERGFDPPCATVQIPTVG